jgi:hypothetical protein
MARRGLNIIRIPPYNIATEDSMRRALLLFITACLLGACAAPATNLPATDTPEYPPQCGWQWATQPLPELSQQVEQAMQAGVQPQARASAQAYGENCIQADGTIAYFATMETDFAVTLTVEDLTDRQALGELLDKTLAVLDQFPAETTPGPQAGYARVTFQHGQDTLGLWFQLSAVDGFRQQGLRGADLLEALENK